MFCYVWTEFEIGIDWRDLLPVGWGLSYTRDAFTAGSNYLTELAFSLDGARCSSMVRAFAHGAMGRRINPSWGGPIELFLVPASAPRLV